MLQRGGAWFEEQAAQPSKQELQKRNRDPGSWKPTYYSTSQSCKTPACGYAYVTTSRHNSFQGCEIAVRDVTGQSSWVTKADDGKDTYASCITLFRHLFFLRLATFHLDQSSTIPHSADSPPCRSTNSPASSRSRGATLRITPMIPNSSGCPRS